MILGSAMATEAEAGGPVCPPAQVFSDVTLATQTQHNTDVANLRDEIAEAKEDLNAENTRMATEGAGLQREAERLQAENLRLS